MVKQSWKHHPARTALVIAAFILVVFRLSLPASLKAYVNHVLDRSPAYDGRVEDIDIALYRGAYTIDGVRIVKTSGNVPVPFFAAQSVEVSVDWSALWHGSIVGEIEMKAPRINFVDGGRASERQAGVDVDWRATIRDLFPLSIDRVSVEEGEVHYADFSLQPDVDVFLSDVRLVAENLADNPSSSQSVATLDVDGTAMHYGKLEAHATLDPSAELPTFALKAQLVGLPLTRVDDLLRTYGRFDVEKGRADISLEVTAGGGRVRGYVKPRLYGVKVLKIDTGMQAGGDAETAWEVFAQAVKGIVESRRAHEVSARVPIEGSLTAPELTPWPALFSELRNAFVAALFHGLDRDIDLSDTPRPARRDARSNGRSHRATEAAARKAQRRLARDARRISQQSADIAGD